MAISVSLLFTASDAGYMFPLRYKNGKLLVIGSSSTPQHYIAEYDLTVSPPNLLRKQTFTNAGQSEFGFFDEQAQVAVWNSFKNSLAVVDYNNFSNKITYQYNVNYPMYLMADKANNVFYGCPSNTIYKTNLSILYSRGDITWTNVSIPSSLDSVQISYWKGKYYYFTYTQQYSLTTRLYSSTDGVNWSLVESTPQSSYANNEGAYFVPFLAVSENYLVHGYFDTSFKFKYTSDGTNFTVFDTGITPDGYQKEYNIIPFIFGKYLILCLTTGSVSGGNRYNILWQVDPTTNTIISQIDISSTFPGRLRGRHIVTEDGRLLLPYGNVNNSTTTGAGILAVTIAAPVNLKTTLSGNVLKATLTDIYGIGLAGKTLRAKFVNHVTASSNIDTNVMTATTDTNGQASFTLPSSGWWQVEFDG